MKRRVWSFFFLSTFISTPDIAAGDLAFSLPAEQSSSASPDTCQLASLFSRTFSVAARVDGDNLVLGGETSKVQTVLSTLKEGARIRQFLLPPSAASCAGTFLAAPRPLSSWQHCLHALGIQPDSVRIVNEAAMVDEGGVLTIPLTSTLNKGVASLYVETLRTASPFFALACQHVDGLVEATDSALTIRYGELTDFLCEVPQTETGDEVSLPLQVVLKRLIAACAGKVTLEKTLTPGVYAVRTLSLGEGQARGKIDVVIDISGSMSKSDSRTSYSRGPSRLDVVNQSMTTLLEKLQQSLPVGTSVTLSIFTLNTKLTQILSFQLSQGTRPPQWQDLKPDGGTDLTHVGTLFPLEPSETGKVVIGFTDGLHESSSSLPDSLEGLRALQATGRFARPLLCKVGDTSDDRYFQDIAGIFAGTSFHTNRMGDFYDALAGQVSDITRARASLVLSLDGANVVVWQRSDRPGLFDSGHTVRRGNTVTYGGTTYPVDLDESALLAAAETLARPVAPDAKTLDQQEQDLLQQLEALRKRRGTSVVAPFTETPPTEGERKEASEATAPDRPLPPVQVAGRLLPLPTALEGLRGFLDAPSVQRALGDRLRKKSTKPIRHKGNVALRHALRSAGASDRNCDAVIAWVARQ